jgi:hypothetical protein
MKIVGNCKHSFCTECLSTVLGSLESGIEVFACASCKVECPRPWDGVQGLVDFRGEDDKDAVVAVQGGADPEKGRSTGIRKIYRKNTINSKCSFCQHRNKEVKAANLCGDCGNLCLCESCTEVHAKNKATEKHAVVPLKIEGTQCETHNSILNSYCVGCQKAVCMICVMFEHGDHTVEKLEDTIRVKVDEVKKTFEPMQEEKLTDLQNLQEELTRLKSMAPMVDRQDTLIKDKSRRFSRLSRRFRRVWRTCRRW